MFKVIIGTSGWWYEHWREKFYPPDLKKNQWFKYYIKFFESVEVNSSFYRLPFPNVVKGWARKAPPEFRFTLKMWRRVTHLKKLKDVEEDVKRFMQRISPLRDNLGAILYQLPPSVKCNLNLLKNFIKQLPQDVDQVVEFRNKSWLTPEVFSLLKEHNVAYCIVSMPDFPELVQTTSNISYIRFHGKKILYGSSYSEQELLKWAKIVKDFSHQDIKRVYIYFNNDYEAFAVSNALRLQEILKSQEANQENPGCG